MDQRLILLAIMLVIIPSIAAWDSWVKLNTHPVCFGARDGKYGSFNVPRSGKIAGIKLVHLSGYVTCDNRDWSHYTFWGCSNSPINRKRIVVMITTSSNTIITPQSPFLINSPGTASSLPGYDAYSPEIILPRFSPYSVSRDQELRLWYGEDLVGHTESDNGGWVCCNVYALYI